MSHRLPFTLSVVLGLVSAIKVLAGADDLYDWALGAQMAYTLSDVKLSLGAGYRESNAYAFDPAQALHPQELVGGNGLVEMGIRM